MSGIRFWPDDDIYFRKGIESYFDYDYRVVDIDILFINLTCSTLKSILINIDCVFSDHKVVVVFYSPELEPIAGHLFCNYPAVKAILSSKTKKEVMCERLNKIYWQGRVWPVLEFKGLINRKEFNLLVYIFRGYDIKEIINSTAMSRSTVYRLRKRIKDKLGVRDIYAMQ